MLFPWGGIHVSAELVQAEFSSPPAEFQVDRIKLKATQH